MAKYEILLFGDGSHLFRTIAWILEYKGYAVKAAASPEAALESLVKKNYDLVIAKLTTKELDGLDVLTRARNLNSAVKVMAISGNNDLTFPIEAYQIEIDDYILMPISPAELWRRVCACLDKVDVVDVNPISGPVAQSAAKLNDRVLHRLMLMLHDIRGSMVSTDAALKLLLRGAHGAMDDGPKARLREVSTRINNLVKLTEEFMSKGLEGEALTDAGQEVLDLQADVVAPVMAELAGEIKDHAITVDNRIQAAAPQVRGNRLWLQSMFRNLVTNGIKHGGPACNLVIDWEKDGANGRLHIYNSGNPVPEASRFLLFSSPAVKTRKAGGPSGGMGMGLYLSRKIAHSQGGDIFYEPRHNGSNFVLTLPRN